MQTKQTNATGTLDFGESWDETVRLERNGETKVTVARVTTGSFTGDIAGDGIWEALLAYPPSTEDSAIFVGYMQVTARLGGRPGTFTLREEGTWEQGALRASWVVVPGSGTGDLKGLRGTGKYHLAADGGRAASYELNYELDEG